MCITESCDERVYPSQVEVFDSVSCDGTVNNEPNCTLMMDTALTDESEGLAEGHLVWKESGSLIFRFSNMPVIDQVGISYYANSEDGLGLPSITITSFPAISYRSDFPTPGRYNVSITRRGSTPTAEELRMTFDPSTHALNEFHLSKVKFYSCSKFMGLHTECQLACLSVYSVRLLVDPFISC
jgi:hypothetical protein